VVDHRAFEGREDFDRALTEVLVSQGADVVCLAGFMRILSSAFVEHWRDRLINIHPSLLPAFKGLRVHERVLEAGVRFTGCTVHFVRPEMDTGPIIVQSAVPVVQDDTPETLAARVLETEHRCYPLALRFLAEARLSIEGDTVRIADLDGDAQRAVPTTTNPPGSPGE
jgi:phosphoribosylglycinamide formyltransferase-1